MFRQFFILLTLIYMISASNPEKPKDGRIVGGKPAIIQDHPHQISLQSVSSGFAFHFCGGSIIAPTLILTAAHCVFQQEISTLQVRAGSANRYVGGVTIRVNSVEVHPKYDPVTNENDIAIIELTEHLTYDDRIQPIKLAPKGFELPDKADMVISGWGATTEGAQTSPNILRAAIVPAVNQAICSGVYGSNPITSQMICAGTFRKDSCQGDSGGPLTYNGYLVGVVSFGSGCGLWPGVYARVSELVDSYFEFLNV